MAPCDRALYVTVTLKDVDKSDAIPNRSITLRSPDWQVKIGRGTLSNQEDLWPAEHNAWFDSRVMSRNHAVLRADPLTKDILIEDVGSMHGTFIGTKRLKAKRATLLWPKDTLILGSDVTRGAACFNALKVKVDWTWSDGSGSHPIAADNVQNTFSADYSDEELYDETFSDIEGAVDEGNRDHSVYEIEDDGEEAQIEHGDDDDDIQEVREPSIEALPPRTFAVPDSDLSDAGSFASGDQDLVEESPTSSPVLPNDANEKNAFVLNSVFELEDLEADEEHSTRYYEWDSASKPIATASVSKEAHPARIEVVSLMDDVSEVECSDKDTSNHKSVPEPNFESTQAPPVSAKPPKAPTASKNPFNTLYDAWAADATRPSNPVFLPTPTNEPPTQPDYVPDNGNTHHSANSDWARNEPGLYGTVPQNATKHSPADVICVYPSLQEGLVQDHAYEGTWELPAPSSQIIHPQPDQSRISIASIVDQVPLEDSNASKTKTSSSLKRKVELISSETSLSTHLGDSDTTLKGITQPLADASSHETSGAPDRLLETTSINPSTSQAVGQDLEMPARKRARRTKHRSTAERGHGSDGFVRIAAAAITGMAIGAVGTIIGLAALPQDYFI